MGNLRISPLLLWLSERSEIKATITGILVVCLKSLTLRPVRSASPKGRALARREHTGLVRRFLRQYMEESFHTHTLYKTTSRSFREISYRLGKYSVFEFTTENLLVAEPTQANQPTASGHTSLESDCSPFPDWSWHGSIALPDQPQTVDHR